MRSDRYTEKKAHKIEDQINMLESELDSYDYDQQEIASEVYTELACARENLRELQRKAKEN